MNKFSRSDTWKMGRVNHNALKLNNYQQFHCNYDVNEHVYTKQYNKEDDKYEKELELHEIYSSSQCEVIPHANKDVCDIKKEDEPEPKMRVLVDQILLNLRKKKVLDGWKMN